MSEIKRRVHNLFYIEWDAPYEDAEQDSIFWLCSENLQLILRKAMPQANIIVEEYEECRNECLG